MTEELESQQKPDQQISGQPIENLAIPTQEQPNPLFEQLSTLRDVANLIKLRRGTLTQSVEVMKTDNLLLPEPDHIAQSFGHFFDISQQRQSGETADIELLSDDEFRRARTAMQEIINRITTEGTPVTLTNPDGLSILFRSIAAFSYESFSGTFYDSTGNQGNVRRLLENRFQSQLKRTRGNEPHMQSCELTLVPADTLSVVTIEGVDTGTARACLINGTYSSGEESLELPALVEIYERSKKYAKKQVGTVVTMTTNLESDVLEQIVDTEGSRVSESRKNWYDRMRRLMQHPVYMGSPGLRSQHRSAYNRFKKS